MLAYDGVLFDLDDTLLDRKATFQQYIETLHRDFNFVWRRGVTKALFAQAVVHLDRDGYAKREVFFSEIVNSLGRKTARDRQQQLIEELTEHYHESFGASALPLPGMVEAISAVRANGLKAGLLTNGSSTQRSKLEQLELDRMLDLVIVSSEVGVHKPDPAIFQLACDRLETAFHRTLYVGDHALNDASAALSAGLDALWIADLSQPWPEEFGEPQPHRLALLTDFPNWLAEQARR